MVCVGVPGVGWGVWGCVVVMETFRTEGEALAKQWGADVMFFETSAKADIAVREVSGEDLSKDNLF